MHRSKPIPLLLTLVLVALGCQPTPPPLPAEGDRVAATAAAQPANLVLITVDTLRADHLSSYGYPRPTSPAFDRVARQGVRFSNAFAQRGLTWPSLTSILTGRYPGSHGVRDNPGWLDASIRTLPEYLKDAGYATGAFLTNMTNAPHRGIDTVGAYPVDPAHEHTNDLLATQAALRWLGARRASEPFFLWLHLLAPHASYAPPSGYDTLFTTADPPLLDGLTPTLTAVTSERRQLTAEELAHVIALYDGEVAFADSLIDLVLRRLDDLALDEHTLVVLTADHGEELYERHQYFFHKCSIYDPVLRIPLVLRLPGRLPPALTVDAVVESIDLAPTITDLLGLPRPPSFQGRSLATLLSPGSPAASAWEDIAFAEIAQGISSVRTDRWRYVANPTAATTSFNRGEGLTCYPIPEEALYDLTNDPGEQTNVAAAHPEVTTELRRRIREWRKATELAATTSREIDAETLAQLRALGYVN